MADAIILPARRPSNAATTFADAAASYINRGGERRYLDRIIAHFGEMPVAEIAPIDVYDMAEALFPHTSNATRNRQALGPARAVLHHAYEKGWRSMIRLRRFKEEEPVRKVPASPAWLHAFLRQCHRDGLPHLAALVLFMASTAARVSEAIRLRWREVDLPRRQVVLLKTKTGRNSVRTLTDEMVERLTVLQTGQGPDDRVFRYLCRQAVNQRIRAVCLRAEITYKSSHACGRHSFASNAIDMGLDIKTTMQAGDWKSIIVFMGTYVHGKANAGRIVADRFGQYDFAADL